MIIPKIDVHCHTTTRFVRDVVDGHAKLVDIRTHMDKYGVKRTVVLPTYFPHKRSGVSNFRLLRWLDQVDPERKHFLMFGSLDLQYYDRMGLNELNELHVEGAIHGIKVYTCYQDVDMNSVQLSDLMSFAVQANLPVMFHTGHSYAARRKYGTDSPAPLRTAANFEKFAYRWMSVPLILSHMSKPYFLEILNLCCLASNVYTDMSGVIDSKYDTDDIPMIVQEIRLFVQKAGSKKILFGTDFPVQTHEHSVMFVEKATKGMGDDVRHDIYHRNAERLLRLSPTE